MSKPNHTYKEPHILDSAAKDRHTSRTTWRRWGLNYSDSRTLWDFLLWNFCQTTLPDFVLVFRSSWKHKNLTPFSSFMTVICSSNPGQWSWRCLSPPRSANEIPSKKSTVFLNWFGCCSPRIPISQSSSSCSKVIGCADMVEPSLSAQCFFIRLSSVNLRRTISWSSINFQNNPLFSR